MHNPSGYTLCDPEAPMREPLYPEDPSSPVCLRVGVSDYPIGWANNVTWRINNGGWQTWPFAYDCPHPGLWFNFYHTRCGEAGTEWQPGGGLGDTVQYYIEVGSYGSSGVCVWYYSSAGLSADCETAQAHAFEFTYPSATPTITPSPDLSFTPTATRTPSPGLSFTPTPVDTPEPTPLCTDPSAYHAPAGGAGCDSGQTMRYPLQPADISQPVCIWLSVNDYPPAGAGQLHFRLGGGEWQTHGFGFVCFETHNYHNVYNTGCGQGAGWRPGAAYGDTVSYYLEVISYGWDTCSYFLCEGSGLTRSESYAASHPFQFTYPDAAPTPSPEPTPVPTVEPTETPAAPPTDTPTVEPTELPTASPTILPGMEFGVELTLPDQVHPGGLFFVSGVLVNTGTARGATPVCFLLEACSTFYFWPSWQPEFTGEGTSFRLLPVPNGRTTIDVIPEFIWPDTGSDAATGLRFYGALLTADMTGIDGQFARAEWTYGPEE